MTSSVSSVISIADLSAKVDGELEAIIGARDFPLYRMMAYHLGWRDAAGQPEAVALRGERVHGALTLLACAAVGGDTDAADALGRSGARLGVAMQIRSDLNQIWGDAAASQPSVEVMNKKKLLPVVYALEKASVSEKRAMGEIYFKRVLEADDAVRLRGVIEGLGARKACEDMVARLTAEAVAELDCAGVSSDGRAQIAGYIRALTE